MTVAWHELTYTPDPAQVAAKAARNAERWYAIGYQTGLTMYHDNPADLAYGLAHYTEAETKTDAHYEAGIRDALRDRLEGRMP